MEAFIRAEAAGLNPSLNFLYTLEAALRDIHIRNLSAAECRSLSREVGTLSERAKKQEGENLAYLSIPAVRSESLSVPGRTLLSQPTSAMEGKNMYRTIEEFVKDWTEESQATGRVLERLTDESLTQEVNAEGRSMGKIAWHIVVTVKEMPESAGLKVDGPPYDTPVPEHAADILAAYKSTAESLVKHLRNMWTDDLLPEEVDMYGEKWTRSRVLEGLLRHEVHHRGQLTVLMRQAGLRVPGVYGPAREEWAEYGMPVAS